MILAGSAPVVLRRMAASDLDAIVRVQAACYPPAMQENAAVLRARIDAAGGTSFVAVGNDAILAYVFAYRSRRGAVTPLDAAFTVLPAGDTLYIHDLAVSPAAAGRGLARALVAQLTALAREAALACCALVSVQGSQAFWEGCGFRASVLGGAQARLALATYPPDAVYMCHEVGANA